jgi:dUTP pyrophosphatase
MHFARLRFFLKNDEVVQSSLMELHIQKLHEEAVLPTYAHDTDAGMDLYCAVDITIAAGDRVQIKTGIALAIPFGYAGLIWDKSGLSHKYGLKVLGGVVDAGYRGEVLVGILNTSTEAYTFAQGDKVAQLLVQKVEHPTIVEVASLEETTRGANGFGSTGT